MDFKKERNIIFAYEGNTRLGGWNISTGEFIGKSGKVIKGTPTCFTYENLGFMHDNLLSGAIRMYRENWQDKSNYFRGAYTPNRANRLEQMISVGIYPSHYNDLDSTIALTKDVVNWVKETYSGRYIDGRVNEYVIIHKFSIQIPNMPKWVQRVIPRLINEQIPESFFVPCLKRAINEAWDFITDNIYNDVEFFTGIITDYYRMSMQMWGKVNIEPNILSNICKIRKLHKAYVKEHYDEMLTANNDKPWLYFENELLTAKPLLTKQDFHDEAEAQHNCVERMYMEKVKDGETHVVRIRYKSDLDHAYITCEVNNRGRIIQYLTACNNHVTDRGGITFFKQYQDHLFSHVE